MRRLIWLLVAAALFIGSTTTMSLSAMLAIGRWWFGLTWSDLRVAAWAEAGLAFWVLAGMARWAAGPRPAYPDVFGDFEEGCGEAVPDGRAEPTENKMDPSHIN